MVRITHAFTACLAIALSIGAQAPDSLVTKRGRELHGRIVERDLDAVTFEDVELGRVRVPWIGVRALRPDGRAETVFDPAWEATAETEQPDGYIRWQIGSPGTADELQTGTARWLHTPTGSRVLLVGVVHIGAADYYERLQAALDTCDVVLFESVGRGDAADAELARLDAMLRMQLLMRDTLGLTFQKDGLNYDRTFWKRADVDFTDLQRSLEAHDTGLPTDVPRLAGLLKQVAVAAEAGKGQRSPIVRARAARLLGPALAQADAIMRQPGLAGLRGALVEDRNRKALDDLRRELTEGPRERTIALLYGAAHLPDFEARLGDDAAFRRQGVEWTTAWRVPGDVALPQVDRRTIDRGIDAAIADFGGRLEVAVWLGAAEGPSWFERGADRMMAAASSIKTAYLAELFATYQDRLDQPLPGIEGIVTDASHPAVVHFDPEIRAAIVREMRGVSVRRVAQMMIHGVGVTNEVYNAAANVTTAVLGGPEALTGRLTSRFGPGIAVRRYMLAARDLTGDNEVSARFLAEVLQPIARGRMHGASAATVQAIRDQLFSGVDPVRGRQYQKLGELDTDPMTRIRSGFFESPGGEKLIYVVMGQLADPGAEPRTAVVARLDRTVTSLTDLVVEAAKQ